MDSYFISICKIGSFMNPFSLIINLSERYFRFRSCYKKKVISMDYDASTSSWKPWIWVRLYLICTMRDIYINSNPNPLTKFTNSSRNTEVKDIVRWNISKINTKTILISTRIVISYTMKWSILLWVWQKLNGNWDNMIRISQWRENHCRKNASIRRKKEIEKSRTVRVTVRDPSRKVKHLCKAIWDRKVIT